MSVAYLSTAYLAPVPYYVKLVSFDEICIETAETYPKQTLRNRCLIAAANGIQALTVPVEKPGMSGCPTRDVRISGHGNWRHVHWNALVSAYRMSPFFEYYADDFRPFYEKAYTYLLDYNEALQCMICGLLDIRPVITRTTAYEPQPVNDFRTTLTARHRPPSGGPPPRRYYQVFRDKHGFIPDLSIVDLLFNMGPESIVYVTRDDFVF